MMSMRTPEPELRPGHTVDDAIAYLIEIRGLANKTDMESKARIKALHELIYQNINRNAGKDGRRSLLFLRILQSKNPNSKLAIEELIRHHSGYDFDVLQTESSRPLLERKDFPIPDSLIAAINRGDESLIKLGNTGNPGLLKLVIEAYQAKDPAFKADAFIDRVNSAWQVARIRQTPWGKNIDHLFLEFHQASLRKPIQPGNILHRLNALEKTILSGLREISAEQDRKIMKENYFTLIAQGLELIFKKPESQQAEKLKDFYGLLCAFAYLKAGNDKQAYEIKDRLSQNAQNALNFMEQRQMEVIREKPSDELLRILKETYQFDVGIKHSVNIEAEYKAGKEAARVDAAKAKAQKPWWRTFGVGGKSNTREQQFAILAAVDKFTDEMSSTSSTWKELDLLLFKLGAMNYLAWQLAQEKRLFGPDSMIEPLILEQRDALIALIRSKGLLDKDDILSTATSILRDGQKISPEESEKRDNHLISSMASGKFSDYWNSMVDSGISKPILSKAQPSVGKWKKMQVALLPEYNKQAETIRHPEKEEETLLPKTRAWLKINQDAWAILEKRQATVSKLGNKAEKRPERP